MDFILNGAPQGDVASVLAQYDYDPNALRPYRGEDGRGTYITVNSGRFDAEGQPIYVPRLVNNAPATLTKDAWRLMDEAIVRTVAPRLRLYGDLVSAGLTFNIPDGLGTTRLDSQIMSDVSAASISMDGLATTDRDRMVYDLVGLPLPIIHKDFGFSMREQRTAARSGHPVDTSMGELAAEKVAEEVELLTVGSKTFSYGGGTVYGYTNHPARITSVSVTDPAGTWDPDTARNEIINMIAAAQAARHWGPYLLYYSPYWMPYMMQRYSTYEAKALSTVLQEIEGLDGVHQADQLTGKALVLVPKRSSTARAVNGLSITTLQWPSQGGMATNFKVMAIMVPQVRADANGVCGIVHSIAS